MRAASGIFRNTKTGINIPRSGDDVRWEACVASLLDHTASHTRGRRPYRVAPEAAVPLYRLVDAEKRHARYPKTFWIPRLSVRKSLKKGDRAQLIFSGKERMWVVVTERHTCPACGRRWYAGTLQNQPVDVPIKFGARMEFKPKHVIQVERHP